MAHLGARVTALADGQLSVVEAERAMVHVVHCPPCAAELAAARAARQALAGAGDILPAPDLTTRLLALSDNLCPPPPKRPGPTYDPLTSTSVPLPRGAGSVAESGGVRRRVLGVFVGAGLLVAVGLFALGDTPIVVPNAHPADPLTVLGRAGADTPVAPGIDVVATDSKPATTLEWMRKNGWTEPAGFPAGYAVAVTRLESEGAVLEVDLTATGDTSADIVVREQVGRLDVSSLAGLSTWDVEGREVYVLSAEPWHVVWQSGATVVDIVADADRADIEQVVAAFPARDYDSGVPARIQRGWTTMTGALRSP